MHPYSAVDDEETFNILAAAIAVHRTMGGGRLESAYKRAVGIELGRRAIPHVREAAIDLTYEGCPVGTYRADFLCYGTVIVEVKASDMLVPQHCAQVMHYLMAHGATRALLINFGIERLRWKRFVRPSSAGRWGGDGDGLGCGARDVKGGQGTIRMKSDQI